MGGAEQFFMRLVKSLNGESHSALAVTRRQTPVAAALVGQVDQLHAPMLGGWDLFSVMAIRDLVRRTGAEIVQTYMGRGTRLTRVAKRSGALHIARLGGFYKIDGYYRHADAWVGNTREICDYMVKEGLPAGRVFHIGNFVDVPPALTAAGREEVRRSLGISSEALIVFALGRFIEKKGFQDLLSAFARLPAEFGGRPLMLVLAGDGPLRTELEDAGTSLGITGRLRWAGWRNDPTPLFQSCDLFVCPSRHEPLGNVILEAWANTLPVVSTATAAARELIREGENGVTAPCEDAAALSERMAAVIRDNSLRETIAREGHRTLVAEHGRAAVVGAYLSLYDQLLGGR